MVAFADGPQEVTTRTPVPSPYKGLRAFTEPMPSTFTGRDGLIDELLRAMSQNRLVAVVGPSGSGKSSVVRAGVIQPCVRVALTNLGIG